MNSATKIKYYEEPAFQDEGKPIGGGGGALCGVPVPDEELPYSKLRKALEDGNVILEN